MIVGDYIDVAWAYLLRQTPVMANPFEYREAMWAILHGDDPPVKAKSTDDKTPAPRALPPARRAPSKTEWNKLAAYQAQIEEIKTRKLAEQGT